MLRLLGIRHDTFAVIERLNPRFVAGALKIRITVETESYPRAPEHVLAGRLLAGFPHLARHECRVGTSGDLAPAPGTNIQLVEDEPSANQAHLLEHLVIDLLSVFEPSVRRSGVTCAWVDPPERNDIFVECREEGVGVAATMLALIAMDSALDDRPLTPLFGDLVRVWAVLAQTDAEPVHPRHVVRRSGLPRHRVEHALALLAHTHLVSEESFALNFSGEAHYRHR